MQVVLLNHSDSLGGASVVTMRLMQALVQLGVDARMLVMQASGRSMRVAELRPRWRRRACFLAEAARIYLGNGFSRENLFKVSVAEWGMPVHEHPWVKDADVVVLNWINQGMLSLSEIGRIKAPVVWTMHDMWPFTGVCHHAGECNRYVADCGYCQYLYNGTRAKDLSSSTLARKAELYAAKKIHFVAVSNWLAQCCRQSSLCKGADVSVIPNAFHSDSYSTRSAVPRSECGLPEGELIAFGAARIDDPVKGLDLAVDALNRLHASGRKATAVFFGAMRDPRALEGLRMPYVHLGMVSDPSRIAELLAHCTVILSSSHYETLPGTLIEGMAAGCIPVAFLHGGQADIVTHRKNGYLATYPDTSDLADGLEWALSQAETLTDRTASNPLSREGLHREIDRLFNARLVANRYLALFNTLIKSPGEAQPL